jgi:CDP-diglyceride synthetase
MIIVPSLLMPVTQTPLSSGRSQPPVTPFGTAPSPMYFARASLAVMSIGITNAMNAAKVSNTFFDFMFPSPLFICFYAQDLKQALSPQSKFLHLIVYICIYHAMIFANYCHTGENEVSWGCCASGGHEREKLS